MTIDYCISIYASYLLLYFKKQLFFNNDGYLHSYVHIDTLTHRWQFYLFIMTFDEGWNGVWLHTAQCVCVCKLWWKVSGWCHSRIQIPRTIQWPRHQKRSLAIQMALDTWITHTHVLTVHTYICIYMVWCTHDLAIIHHTVYEMKCLCVLLYYIIVYYTYAVLHLYVYSLYYRYITPTQNIDICISVIQIPIASLKINLGENSWCKNDIINSLRWCTCLFIARCRSVFAIIAHVV